jgi:hypothetical protein
LDSKNGVYLNCRRLEPYIPYSLLDGDRIQFGINASPNHSSSALKREDDQFLYTFRSFILPDSADPPPHSRSLKHRTHGDDDPSNSHIDQQLSLENRTPFHRTEPTYSLLHSLLFLFFWIGLCIGLSFYLYDHPLCLPYFRSIFQQVHLPYDYFYFTFFFSFTLSYLAFIILKIWQSRARAIAEQHRKLA